MYDFIFKHPTLLKYEIIPGFVFWQHGAPGYVVYAGSLQRLWTSIPNQHCKSSSRKPKGRATVQVYGHDEKWVQWTEKLHPEMWDATCSCSLCWWHWIVFQQHGSNRNMLVSTIITLLETKNRSLSTCTCMEILCTVKWSGSMDYVDPAFCIDSFVENN